MISALSPLTQNFAHGLRHDSGAAKSWENHFCVDLKDREAQRLWVLGHKLFAHSGPCYFANAATPIAAFAF